MFAAALARNRYDHVDSIVFRTLNGDTFAYTFFDDAFPRGVSQRVIRFDSDQFDDAWFRRVDGSELTVFIPRVGDPSRDSTPTNAESCVPTSPAISTTDGAQAVVSMRPRSPSLRR